MREENMRTWLCRAHDAPLPFQTWSPFPPEAIVQVRGIAGTRIAQAKDLWWGYETEMGGAGEGVILYARRLDRPRTNAPFPTAPYAPRARMMGET